MASEFQGFLFFVVSLPGKHVKLYRNVRASLAVCLQI